MMESTDAMAGNQPTIVPIIEPTAIASMALATGWLVASDISQAWNDRHDSKCRSASDDRINQCQYIRFGELRHARARGK